MSWSKTVLGPLEARSGQATQAGTLSTQGSLTLPSSPAATCGTAGGLILVSGATKGMLPESDEMYSSARIFMHAEGDQAIVVSVEALTDRPMGRSHATVRPMLRSLVLSTLLPFSHVEQALFRVGRGAEAAHRYVLSLGGEIEQTLEDIPTIVAGWPQRRTYRFSRPIRRLPARSPFIPRSGVPDEE